MLDNKPLRYDGFRMTVLSVKLDDELESKLVARAKALGLTKSEVVRQVIAEMDDSGPSSIDEALAEARAINAGLKPAEIGKESRVIAMRKKRMFHARLR